MNIYKTFEDSSSIIHIGTLRLRLYNLCLPFSNSSSHDNSNLISTTILTLCTICASTYSYSYTYTASTIFIPMYSSCASQPGAGLDVKAVPNTCTLLWIVRCSISILFNFFRQKRERAARPAGELVLRCAVQSCDSVTLSRDEGLSEKSSVVLVHSCEFLLKSCPS